MNENQVGLNLKVAGVGYVGVRFAGRTVSDVKSVAGKAFHLPHVKSVCVYTPDGQVPLYLRKDELGHCDKREEREV